MRRWFRRTLASLLAFGAVGQQGIAGLAAQSSTPKWEIEVFGGLGLATNPGSGTGQLPPPGDSFRLPSGQLTALVYSWYFGAGTTTFLQAQSPGNPNRIVPLDPVLTGPVAHQRAGAELGVRIRRRVGSRVSAEVALSYARGALKLTEDALRTIEETSRTFETAWQSFFAAAPSIYINPMVTSTRSIVATGSSRIATTASMIVNLTTESSTVPYLALGAGVSGPGRNPPTVTLTGTYSFLANGTAPVNETDRATVRYLRDGTSWVGIVGGGVKRYVSNRWGLSGDVRLGIGGAPHTTTVSADPEVTLASPTGFIIETRNRPLVFSTVANPPSSLSAAPVADFETFRTTGRRWHVAATLGIFARF